MINWGMFATLILDLSTDKWKCLECLLLYHLNCTIIRIQNNKWNVYLGNAFQGYAIKEISAKWDASSIVLGMSCTNM